jgi:hypothetical protein
MIVSIAQATAVINADISSGPPILKRHQVPRHSSDAWVKQLRAKYQNSGVFDLDDPHSLMVWASPMIHAEIAAFLKGVNNNAKTLAVVEVVPLKRLKAQDLIDTLPRPLRGEVPSFTIKVQGSNALILSGHERDVKDLKSIILAFDALP